MLFKSNDIPVYICVCVCFVLSTDINKENEMKQLCFDFHEQIAQNLAYLTWKSNSST